jgi:Concanavalin A-like lectin/glucanases superfamily
VLSSAAVRKPTKTLPGALAGVLALACVGAAAACGFDGHASLATSSSAIEPPPNKTPEAPPDGGPPQVAKPPADSGAETSTPILTCTDPVLSFDGIDDGATVPDDAALDIRGDFTVEAWIKPSAKATTEAEMDVISHHDATDSTGWVLLVKSGRVEIVVYGTDFGGDKGYSAGNEGAAYVVPGKWAHVAGTRSGDTLRIYYDGVLRDSQDLGLTFGRDYFSGALRIGRAATTTTFNYQGELDDVRISKVARYTGSSAPKPIAALPIDADTIAAWRFDEPSANVLVDTALHNHDGSLAPDATAAARVPAPCINAR